MAKPFFIVISPEWLARADNRKHVSRGRVALDTNTPEPFDDRCLLFVRRRDDNNDTLTSDQGQSQVAVIDGETFLQSRQLCLAAESAASRRQFLVLYCDGTRKFSRCLAMEWAPQTFADLDRESHLQLDTYQLPPATTALVDGSVVVRAFRDYGATHDPDLFAVQAARFLDGPHVLERLFDHLMELRAIEAPNFITVTKGLSAQLRDIMTTAGSPIQIRSVAHSHLNLWASVQGQPMSFIDGGVARFDGYPGIEQFAMRVGTYRVTPGETDPTTREKWSMFSRVLADVVQSGRRDEELPDRKRLQEAIRYTLEASVLMRELESGDPPICAFLHGPLVNQFVTYDEGEPYFLPNLLPEFLDEFGINEESVVGDLQDVPRGQDGNKLWNQFMAVYGVIIRRVLRSETPAVGVVERLAGRSMTNSLFNTLASRNLIQERFARQFQDLLHQYGITDDLLFGCILKQGEYITPITIKKNPLNRARDRWQAVVRQYGHPRATMIKPQDGTFPVRLEFNASAAEDADRVVSISYHTSRLLPRYAFPVGLDIVDKFAKVPDWMTRAVSTAGAAVLLKKALDEAEDPAFVAQVRRVLAGQPRDFFFRPNA